MDNAAAFQTLVGKNDPHLQKAEITLVLSEVMNKNSNAVIDKGILELEKELLNLQPDGQPISQTTLSIAINNLNSKRLRRNGKLTASEIHTSRDAWSGANLSLDDNKIFINQNETRSKNNEYHNKKIQSQSQPASTVGDIVHLRKKHEDKHQVRDTFIVTDQVEDKLNIQKVLNAQNEKVMQLRSKSYLVSPQSVYTAKSFPSQFNFSTQKQDQYTPNDQMLVNSNIPNTTSTKQCFPTPASSKIKLPLPFTKMSHIPESESDSEDEENDYRDVINIQDNKNQ